jgi:hypothetical protein
MYIYIYTQRGYNILDVCYIHDTCVYFYIVISVWGVWAGLLGRPDPALAPRGYLYRRLPPVCLSLSLSCVFLFLECVRVCSRMCVWVCAGVSVSVSLPLSPWCVGVVCVQGICACVWMCMCVCVVCDAQGHINFLLTPRPPFPYPSSPFPFAFFP